MRHHGFTLIEYIVTTSLIGILAATFVLSSSHFFPSIKLNGAANNLTSNLRQAQEEAVTTQIAHSLRFNSATGPTSYELIKIDNGNETVIKTVNLPSTLTSSIDPTIASHEIIFSPDGGPSSAGNITFSSGAKTKTVNVSPAGVIKTQ